MVPIDRGTTTDTSGYAITGLESTITAEATTGGVVLQQFGDFAWLAIVFFALAILAAIVGFRGVAGLSMQIAKIFIFVFLVLAVVALVL